ncbi:MAG: helix-turn-helix transcriptional regulator [Actinomycetes bacterium]|jgi:transcriptional regulator with XRE-family HTH domain
MDQRLYELGEFIRLRREAAQQSIRDLSRIAGISNPYLSQIERGLRKPSADILQQIAKALQISAETLYVQAGILDGDTERFSGQSPQPKDGSVEEAIHEDALLSDVQKETLLSVYRSYVNPTIG